MKRRSGRASASGAPGSFVRPRLARLLLLPLLLPAPLLAQTLAGRVVDESTDAPVGGAVVSLLSRDGTERARALTGADGAFLLSPPDAGEYYLLAARLGYVETRSPLLALAVEGRTTIELLLAPAPLGLEGLEVSVEERAAAELAAFGLTPAQLGSRWIDRREIDAVQVKRDVGTIIEALSVPGTRVVRMENVHDYAGDLGLCIAQSRARSASGWDSCGLIMLDGVPVTRDRALQIDPEAIESIAVLVPREAATFLGTMGGSGAVLIWTRRGR